jgi:hypothetical protein
MVLYVFPDRGYVERASFQGELVRSRQMADLRLILDGHLAPTEADLARLLAKSDSQFGPDRREQFIDRLNLQRFEAALGPILRSSIEFVWRVGMPSWRVEVETKPVGVRLCTLMLFEPISGHPWLIASAPCSP